MATVSAFPARGARGRMSIDSFFFLLILAHEFTVSIIQR